MIDNTVTLPVDVLNDGVLVNKTFTRYEEFQNRSKYISSSHTLSLRDFFDIYRTTPKKTGNFCGTAKSAVKFTMDVEVPGADSATTLTAPQILEVSFSLPVGSTAEQVVVLRQRAIAFLDNDTLMDRINLQLEV